MKKQNYYQRIKRATLCFQTNTRRKSGPDASLLLKNYKKTFGIKFKVLGVTCPIFFICLLEFLTNVNRK